MSKDYATFPSALIYMPAPQTGAFSPWDTGEGDSKATSDRQRYYLVSLYTELGWSVACGILQQGCEEDTVAFSVTQVKVTW